MSSKKKWLIIYIVIGLVALGLFFLAFMLMKGKIKKDIDQVENTEEAITLQTEHPESGDLDVVNKYSSNRPIEYAEEAKEDKPDFIPEENKYKSKKVAKLVDDTAIEYSDEFASQIYEDYPRVFDHIRGTYKNQIGAITKQEEEYVSLEEKLKNYDINQLNIFSHENTLDLASWWFEPGESLHLFTDFEDYVWFSFSDCLYLIGALDDTTLIYTPYDTFNKKFLNKRELVVKDYNGIYFNIENDASKKVSNLGDVDSLANGFVKGTRLEDYEDYKILYTNMYSTYFYNKP